jgi:hypothetical protein
MVARTYRDKVGKRLPSVTTILSRFKDSGALIHWAWNEGVEGRDYRESRRLAAAAGSIAHQMVEARLRALPWKPDLPIDQDLIARARAGFDAYLAWERMTRLEFLHSEVSLVSTEFEYGGTLDAIGSFEGSLVLIDWKTSNAVYSDYLIQLAAYRALWEENYPDHPISGGFHLCRFSKENGDFSHHYYPNLDEAWDAFKIMRRLFDLDKALRRRAA